MNRTVLLTLLACGAARAADAPDYAENLARLRGEVEALSGEVELRKEELRGDLRAWSAQEAEIQAAIRQQELRLEQLTLAAERERALVTEGEAAAVDLTEAVLAGARRLEETVAAGLPFRTGDRLAELERIREQLEGGDVPPERAASLLWGFVEDELRLARENTLDRQVITLDGETVLVSVARLGMVALYFRTEDGRVGAALPEGGGWRWAVYEDAGQARQVSDLFDALARQIRSGFFELPGAWRAPVAE